MEKDTEKLKELQSRLNQEILNMKELLYDFDEDFFEDINEAIFYLKEGRDVLDWIIDCAEYRQRNK